MHGWTDGWKNPDKLCKFFIHNIIFIIFYTVVSYKHCRLQTGRLASAEPNNSVIYHSSVHRHSQEVSLQSILLPRCIMEEESFCLRQQQIYCLTDLYRKLRLFQFSSFCWFDDSPSGIGTGKSTPLFLHSQHAYSCFSFYWPLTTNGGYTFWRFDKEADRNKYTDLSPHHTPVCMQTHAQTDRRACTNPHACV